MKNIIKYITFFAIAFAISSCGTSASNSTNSHNQHEEGNYNHDADNHDNHEGHDHGSEGHGKDKNDNHDGHAEEDHDEHEEGGLHLTTAQIKTVGLEFGSFSNIKVNDFVKASGTLDVPPSAFASVSVKTEGILTGGKKYIEGNQVKKGEIIAYLENPDFIVLQQNYLETIAQLKYERLEYNRQKSLVDANAGISKNLESARSKVEILEAKSMGIAKRLSYLGISVDNLTSSSIKQSIPIYAPMSGYISKVNFHNGMYVQPTSSLMEIMDDDHLHLELNVFEKDIAQIKIGQKISFVTPALGNTIYEGEVSIIGKEFNQKSKTIRVHGHLHGKQPKFIRDLFINAKIWMNNATVEAVPEDAIINDEGSSFLYVGNMNPKDKEVEFEKILVVPGASNNGFRSVKLIDEIPENHKIVTKGAYYIYAQSKSGELSHEH